MILSGDADNPRKKLNEGLISGSIGMISRMAAQLCLLVVTLTATRLLAVSQFGIYSIAASLMVLSRNLFYVGSYEYLLKTPPSRGLQGACLKANLCLAAVASVFLLLFSFVAEFGFHSSILPFVLVRLTPSLFLSAITAWYEAILLRRLEIRRYYIFTVIGELTATIATVACFAGGLGIVSLIVQIYTRLLVLAVLYGLTTRDTGWRFGHVAEVEAILRWSWSRFGAVFLNFSGNYGADFVLGIALSPAATGIYRASNRIVSAVSDLFAQPLQKIVQTNLSANAARGLPPSQAWISMLLGVAALGWAALIGLAAAAWVLVPVVLGPAWKNAVPVVMIFCFARALSLIDVTTTSLLVCCDRQRFMLAVQVMVAVGVPVASLAVASHFAAAVGIAPGAVAIVNTFIMSGLTFAYCREAARLSHASLWDLGCDFALALVPGLCVAVVIFLLGRTAIVDRLPSLALLTVLVAGGAVGLAGGLLLIRRRLFASIAALGTPLQPVGLPA